MWNLSSVICKLRIPFLRQVGKNEMNKADFGILEWKRIETQKQMGIKWTNIFQICKAFK